MPTSAQSRKAVKNLVKKAGSAASGNAAELNLRHLQLELARLDLRLQRSVELTQRAGQDPNDQLRGLHISDADASELAGRPVAHSRGATANRSTDEESAWERAEAEAQLAAQSWVDACARNGHTLRLAHLAACCGLSQFDVDALLICMAPALDLRYEKLYGYLNDDVTRKRPSANLILDLLGPAGVARSQWLSHFTPNAPLLAHHLIEATADTANGPLLGQSFMADEWIVNWLMGHANQRPHAQWTPHLLLKSAGDEMRIGHVIETLDNFGSAVRLSGNPLLCFWGADTAAAAIAVRWLAHGLNQSLLVFDLARVEAAAREHHLRLALRDATLLKAVLMIQSWDEVLATGVPPRHLLEMVLNHPGVVIVGSNRRWHARELDRKRIMLWLEFPVPGFGTRQQLWQHYLAGEGHSAHIDEAQLLTLTGQFHLTATQIRDCVADARDLAAAGITPEKALDPPHITPEHLFAAARQNTSPQLSGMARKISPRYAWDDIVLPDDQKQLLTEIVSTVRMRPQVLDEWGLGRKLTASNGVTVLFAGPPGTGKTMAAEIIAGELGLDLYKIELSSLVSKYIGETEKNLEKIFAEAESSSAILFFDEADAIFGKRSEVKDAHDRYANIEVSYLLQRMESYDGVTILATNLRANLDEAFTRRLQFAIDFPFPDEQYRFKIWQTLFPASVPNRNLDFGTLARRHRLAGGAIRNIIVSASYLAASDGGVVTMSHLQHGVRRELQKMGRLVQE